MKIKTESYLKQLEKWPETGKHILANYDDETIIVYQAYRPSIGNFALENGYFGGDFKYTRMSWIKTNFLWMMYRSGWGTKPDQEIILAIRLKTTFFDSLLTQTVDSSYSVCLQWDPDHDPLGDKVARRAIQLGLRNDILEYYGKKEIIEIIDMTDFVAEQRQNITDFNKLIIPKERVYNPD
jgi:hypothetical protein